MKSFSWEFISKEEVTKDLDFSCFEHNTSTIDKNFYSFFNLDAENKDKVNIELIDPSGKKYTTYVRHAGESRESSPAKLIVWNKAFTDYLKQHFPNWREIKQGEKPENYKLIFNKTDVSNTYNVSTKEVDNEQLTVNPANKKETIEKFGELPGIKVGDLFKDREELSESGLHKPPMAGIWGSQEVGAYSIVLSGGYEDDIDQLDYILYTGQGGQDVTGGKQVKDQEFTRGNKALGINLEEHLPVRVTRGYQVDYGPENGYRYDGIYYVQNLYKEKGKSGFYIYRFELITAQNFEYLKENIENTFKEDYELPERSDVISSRIKRNQKIVKRVKELHNFTCQVCGEYFEGVNGPIAIGAHIQGLGGIHNGPDVIENLLCLCPNHHELFDYFGFYIDEDFSIKNLDQDLPKNLNRKLILNKKHNINPEFLRYHKTKYLESYQEF